MTRITVIRPYAALPSEGGSNDRYVNLCRSLETQGACVELLVSDFIHNSKKRRAPEARALNARFLPFLVQLSSLSYRANLSTARIAHEIWFGFRALAHIARTPRPAAILVGEPLFGVGWLMILYGFFRGIPVLGDVIDLWPEADTQPRQGVAAWLRRAVYGVLATSRGLRLRLYRGVSFVSLSYAERLKPSAPVFYWGSELSPGQTRAAPAQAPYTVIYAGSFGEGYDIETALAAAKHMRAASPGRFRFLFAGSGPQLAAVQRAAADGSIDYLGVLDRASLLEAYEKADIGLLPYKRGSQVAMPIKFFDYLNFGLYVLTSLELEAGHLVRAQGIGACYRAGDAEDLCRKLEDLAQSPVSLSAARGASLALAQEFSIDAQYARFARFVLSYTQGAR